MNKDDHMRRLMLVFTLLLPAAANAQQVHKCVKGKDVSYQSAPCADGQATARTWEAQPDPVHSQQALPSDPLPSPARKLTNGSRQGKAAKRKGSGMTGASIPVENSGNSRACQAAKASRARTLERVGLKRTFDLLSKLDNAVHSACR